MAQMGRCIFWEHLGRSLDAWAPRRLSVGWGGAGASPHPELQRQLSLGGGVGGSWLRWEWGFWQDLGLISGIGGCPHPCHWASLTGVRP